MPNQNNTPNFEVLHMPPENTNSLLVTSGGDAVIFDAWGRADAWEKLLESRGLRLRAIYSTHGHGDHISAAPELAEKYNVPWYLNSEDNVLISWSDGLLEYFGLPKLDGNYRAPTDIDSGNIEILPNIYMDVIETPGHSAGGMSYYFPDFGVLVTGDTLFRDSCGRYDLPGGDMNALMQSIAKIYEMNLPDETYVVHGHGIDSTIGILKKENPYFKE